MKVSGSASAGTACKHLDHPIQISTRKEAAETSDRYDNSSQSMQMASYTVARGACQLLDLHVIKESEIMQFK
jgi:hypothetical protein